jgi:hypothetical protein
MTKRNLAYPLMATLTFFPMIPGRLVGRFYRKDGLPTSELTQVEAMVTKGMEANEQEQREKQKFPPCNSEWSSAKGSRLWCSQKR